jgi:hypothetical protein
MKESELITIALFLILLALWRIGDWLRRGVKAHTDAMDSIYEELTKRTPNAP